VHGSRRRRINAENKLSPLFKVKIYFKKEGFKTWILKPAMLTVARRAGFWVLPSSCRPVQEYRRSSGPGRRDI
jgi:hypothetical protein